MKLTDKYPRPEGFLVGGINLSKINVNIPSYEIDGQDYAGSALSGQSASSLRVVVFRPLNEETPWFSDRAVYYLSFARSLPGNLLEFLPLSEQTHLVPEDLMVMASHPPDRLLGPLESGTLSDLALATFGQSGSEHRLRQVRHDLASQIERNNETAIKAAALAKKHRSFPGQLRSLNKPIS